MRSFRQTDFDFCVGFIRIPLQERYFRVISIGPDGTLIGSTLPTQRINNTPVVRCARADIWRTNSRSCATDNLDAAPGGDPLRQPRLSVHPFQHLHSVWVPRHRLRPHRNPLSRLGRQSRRGDRRQTVSNSRQVELLDLQASSALDSDSSETSIKVYNQRQKYNEWEFIAIMTPTAPSKTQDGEARSGNGHSWASRHTCTCWQSSSARRKSNESVSNASHNRHSSGHEPLDH